MKEVNFKYFLNGEEVERESIDWDRTMSVIPKHGDEIHITYMSRPSHTPVPPQFDEAKDIERFLEFAMGAQFMGAADVHTEDTPINIYEEVTLPMGRESIKVKILSDEAGQWDSRPLGVKHNKHKAPLDIVQTRQFPKALQLIALATAFGNKKYEATDKDFLNFKRVAGGSQTYFDAAARHNADRNEIDSDSGLPHVIHAVWDMLAALEINIEENGIDVKEFSKNYLENLHNPK